MLLDRPKDEIARDLLTQAANNWGAGRAEALRRQIEEVAGWLSLIAACRLEIDGEEPDFLVAPPVGSEGR